MKNALLCSLVYIKSLYTYRVYICVYISKNLSSRALDLNKPSCQLHRLFSLVYWLTFCELQKKKFIYYERCHYCISYAADIKKKLSLLISGCATLVIYLQQTYNCPCIMYIFYFLILCTFVFYYFHQERFQIHTLNYYHGANGVCKSFFFL